MKQFFYTLPAFALFFLFLQKPANDPNTKIVEGLKQWYENNPQEKVFVQTDKDQYLAGEQLWMKAWCTIENKPSFLSRILYAELVNEQGRVVAKKMFQLDSLSSAQGMMDLPMELPGGYYSINAYTLWMMNYKDFVFRKSVYIANGETKKENKPQTSALLMVKFFPEGGDLVEGTSSRIAFKATDKYGIPLAVQGKVVDGAGNKLADLNTAHEGMGMFELTPAANGRYKAMFDFNGRPWEFVLPQAKKDGIVLQVNNSNPNRLFIMLNTPATSAYKKSFVVAHVNGMPVYSAPYNLAEGENGGVIQKKNLPAGIMHVTAFDSAGVPLAERIAFIANYELSSPLISGTTNYNNRGLNEWKIEGAKGNIAVSVTDADLGTSDEEDNVLSSLLLTTDIKGYVHNPAYYFRNKNDSTLNNLDLLLMTQGWRRFNWKQIKGEETFTLKYPVETVLNIKGKVTKSGRETAVTKGTVDFIIKGDDSSTVLSTAYLTDKGEFMVDSLSFRKKATISYMGNNEKNGLPVDVKFYPNYIDTLTVSTYTSLVPEAVLYSQLLTKQAEEDADKRSKILQGVTVTAKKKSRIDSLQQQYVSPIFEQSDQTLDIPENVNYMNIWQYLNGKVSGFNVNAFTPGGVQSVSFGRNEGLGALSQDTGSSRNIQFFLNEMQVGADVIDMINPSDVALIKVYKGALAFPFGADGGVIAVYTKRGVNTAAGYTKIFNKIERMGYEVEREFYSPDYTLNPDLNKGDKDNRITLFWKPKLVMGSDGKYTVRFHNNDRTKKFRITVQGLDEKGGFIYGQVIR